ncbi:DNA-binding CsgD family transcriptional regulator [Williamsia limnetica]|jgi:DNA-binding CsgD family transcriptional regulator|uniref:DNA-binding CsgD family transcriptional regulator n=1 Tax=Williamsia limnetica TaxID=882452 RepID=A0A318S5T8_WILLI|nr:helix-turn-helix transcriptional regulator [Williamsia limnetica]PYE19499.1 DNA-binding CsgD family transcriptional regulator [Williamsia limnetica]
MYTMNPEPDVAVTSVPTLSAREIEVLRTWFTCDSKSEAARKLFITPATVNTHITRIRDKYDAVGRSGATKSALLARALQDGLISVDEL